MKSLYAHFGAMVKESRLRRNLTQSALARDAHLSRASIANIESGHHRVLLHHAIELANTLEIPLADLQRAYQQGKLQKVITNQNRNVQELITEVLARSKKRKGA